MGRASHVQLNSVKPATIVIMESPQADQLELEQEGN